MFKNRYKLIDVEGKTIVHAGKKMEFKGKATAILFKEKLKKEYKNIEIVTI